jgi:hypothetical protein
MGARSEKCQETEVTPIFLLFVSCVTSASSLIDFLEVFPILLVSHIRVLIYSFGEVKEDRLVRVAGNHRQHRRAIMILIDAALAGDRCSVYFADLFALGINGDFNSMVGNRAGGTVSD